MLNNVSYRGFLPEQTRFICLGNLKILNLCANLSEKGSCKKKKKKKLFREFDCFKLYLFKMTAWLKEKKLESSGTLPWRNYIFFK